MKCSTGSDVFDMLGVSRVINGFGWITAVGGSIMDEEVSEAMSKAADTYLDLNELNLAAGKFLAQHTDSEAGLVVAGAGAGLLLQAAACIAGQEPDLIERLPNTQGIPNEVLLYKDHVTNYSGCYRSAGAKVVIWGNGKDSPEDQLRQVIGKNTVALAYVFHQFNSCPIPLERAVEIAHEKSIPVVVDAAVMLPPVKNLTEYINKGADMVTFSGGKGLRGPQSTGILCGRADLIESARLNMSPYHSVGRAAKVCKEEIAGVIKALEIFVKTDHESEWEIWKEKSFLIKSIVEDIPALNVVVEDNDPNRRGPALVIYFEDDWRGPDSETVLDRLSKRNPSIRIGLGGYENELVISPVALKDGEEEEVGRALREDLLNWD